MKCQICKSKITWDESFGPNNFLVCSDCERKMHEIIGDGQKTLTLIFELGRIRSFKDIEKTWQPIDLQKRRK